MALVISTAALTMKSKMAEIEIAQNKNIVVLETN